jgi:hypothetical protein
MKWIASLALLCSFGCAQWNGTVGSYAGLDVELGYNRNFGNNDITGTSIPGKGKGEGHSSSVWDGNTFSNDAFGMKFRVLFRPKD